MQNPGAKLLEKGLLTCPECTVQREARLRAELQVPGLTLALAKAIKGRLSDGPATFHRLTGQTLEAFITAYKASKP